MNTDFDIPPSEWRALYKAAGQFREIEPWAWVTEADVFGVQDPVTGRIGYCCVTGELGEVLGMAVYLGTGGLEGYLMLQNGEVGLEDSDAMFAQDCILVSFENKSHLAREDKAVIKELGIQAKGKRAWPMFRRHEPGFFPWFLKPEDVVFLTAVLEQAREICLRIGKDEELLNPPKKGAYFVRTYNKDGSRWEDTWQSPEPLAETVQRTSKPDELALQRIKKNIRTSNSVWEVDTFYTPAPIGEEGRPYYPYCILIADKDSGVICDVYLAERGKAPGEFANRLLSCIENTGILPAELRVKRREAAELISPVAEGLAIKIRTVEKLPAVEEARRSMERHLLKKIAPPADQDDADYELEALLDKTGAEISIYGLYGLIYGCLAAPGLVMPSALMPAIFGKDGATFDSESQARATIDSIMELWNRLNQLDAEEREIIIPVFEYPMSREGALQRCADALDFISLFFDGLTLGGLHRDTLPADLKEDAAQLRQIADLLYQQAELLGKTSRPGRSLLKGAMQSIDKAEIVIDGCITDIFRGLRKARTDTAAQVPHSRPVAGVVPLQAGEKVGRNEPCPCGSGRKYKKCCGMTH